MAKVHKSVGFGSTVYGNDNDDEKTINCIAIFS